MLKVPRFLALALALAQITACLDYVDKCEWNGPLGMIVTAATRAFSLNVLPHVEQGVRVMAGGAS